MFQGWSAVIYKEALQIRRDPSTRIVFMIPLIQTIIFGFAIDMDIQYIKTVVFDMERSAESRGIVKRFENTNSFDIIGNVSSEEAVREAIVAGRAKVGIIIPPDFSSRLLTGAQARLQLLIDGSDSTVAMNAIQSSRAVSLIESMGRLGISVSEVPVDARPRVLFNPDLISSHFYVPGLVGTILQIVTTMLTAFSIVRERERGTLEQILATPISRVALVTGKLVPYAGIGVVQTVVVLTIMRGFFGVQIEGNLFLLLSLSVLFLLPALSLGILISTFSTTQAQAMQLGLLIILPSILLSGFAFPRETMPWPIYAISYLIPVTYYIQILRGIILRGAGLKELWPQALALLGFGLALVALSTMRFKKRLR